MCFFNFFTILSNLELSLPQIWAYQKAQLHYFFHLVFLSSIKYPFSTYCVLTDSASGTACVMGQPQLQWQITMLLVTQSCPALCASMDCDLPGSSVHGIFQKRILEWASISSSRGSHNLGIEPMSLALLQWQADSLPLSHLGSPYNDDQNSIHTFKTQNNRRHRCANHYKSIVISFS